MRRSTVLSLPPQLVFPGEIESTVIGSGGREDSKKEGREEEGEITRVRRKERERVSEWKGESEREIYIYRERRTE